VEAEHQSEGGNAIISPKIQSQKTNGGIMERTIRVKFSNGVIKPLERLDIEEGKELTITIKEAPEKEHAFERAGGSWKGTLDFDEFIKDLYASRRSYRKSEVKL